MDTLLKGYSFDYVDFLVKDVDLFTTFITQVRIKTLVDNRIKIDRLINEHYGDNPGYFFKYLIEKLSKKLQKKSRIGYSITITQLQKTGKLSLDNYIDLRSKLARNTGNMLYYLKNFVTKPVKQEPQRDCRNHNCFFSILDSIILSCNSLLIPKKCMNFNDCCLVMFELFLPLMYYFEKIMGIGYPWVGYGEFSSSKIPFIKSVKIQEGFQFNQPESVIYEQLGIHINFTNILDPSSPPSHFTNEKCDTKYIQLADTKDMIKISNLRLNCHRTQCQSLHKACHNFSLTEQLVKQYSGENIKLTRVILSLDQFNINRHLEKMFIMWSLVNGLPQYNFDITHTAEFSSIFCNHRFVLYLHYFVLYPTTKTNIIQGCVYIWDRLNNLIIKCVSQSNLAAAGTGRNSEEKANFWKYLFKEDIQFSRPDNELCSTKIELLFDLITLNYFPVYSNTPVGCIFPKYCDKKNCSAILKRGIFAWASYSTINDYPFVVNSTDMNELEKSNFCRSYGELFCTLDSLDNIPNDITERIKNLIKLRFSTLLLMTDATCENVPEYRKLDDNIEHFVSYIFHEQEEINILKRLSTKNTISKDNWSYWIPIKPFFNVQKTLMEIVAQGIKITGIEKFNSLSFNVYFNDLMLPK